MSAAAAASPRAWGKIARRTAGAALLVIGPGCTYVAYKYRPRASFDVDYHESLVRLKYYGKLIRRCKLIHPSRSTRVLGEGHNVILSFRSFWGHTLLCFYMEYVKVCCPSSGMWHSEQIIGDRQCDLCIQHSPPTFSPPPPFPSALYSIPNPISSPLTHCPAAHQPCRAHWGDRALLLPYCGQHDDCSGVEFVSRRPSCGEQYRSPR